MSKWKKTVYAFFSMHAQERKAVWQLAGISATVILLLGLKTYFHEPPQTDPESLAYFEAKVENWRLQKQIRIEASLADIDPQRSIETKTAAFFDPNTLTDQGWVELGLSEKQLKTLRNYLATGAVFNNLDDLRKVYSLGDSFVARYGQYVRFQEVQKEQVSAIKQEAHYQPAATLTKTFEKKPITKVDINTIDSIGLVALNGVGPFYARQIIRTRSELGGFYSLQQLEEVWKMRPETLESILAQSEIVSPHTCLDINLAKAEELAKHPYIDWNLARSIVNFREAHGAFNNQTDFRKLHLLEESTWLKLQPYLCLHGSD
jgi:competence protein ComEA